MSGFLENIVANALQNALGAFFVGVEKQRLKVDVFSGEVVLRNLPVREDALYTWQQPYRVRWGVVGTLRIKVPWQRLGREPVEIRVEDLNVLLEPIKEWDQDEYRRMVRKGKEEQVQEAVLLRQKEEHEKKARGFFGRLEERVLDNLTIEITNVHIRYEDDFTAPERPFAVGLTLSRLHTYTTTEGAGAATASAASASSKGGHGARASRGDGARGDTVHKRLDVENLALYWHSEGGGGTSDWFGRDPDLDKLHHQSAVRARFAAYLHVSAGSTSGGAASDAHPTSTGGGGAKPSPKFLLAPVSATMQLWFAKRHGGPKVELSMTFEQLDLQLYEDWYADIATCLVYTDLFERWGRYRRWGRPPHAPRTAPRAWWVYAGRCIAFDLAQTRARAFSTWATLTERNEVWRRAVTLSVRRHAAPLYSWIEPLSDADENVLLGLEDTMEVDEILTCRGRAEAHAAYRKACVAEARQLKAERVPLCTALPGRGESTSGWSRAGASMPRSHGSVDGSVSAGSAPTLTRSASTAKGVGEVSLRVCEARMGARHVASHLHVNVHLDENCFRTPTVEGVGASGVGAYVAATHAWPHEESGATCPLAEGDECIVITVREVRHLPTSPYISLP